MLETEEDLAEAENIDLGGGGDDILEAEECAPVIMARLDDVASTKRLIRALPNKFRYDAMHDVLEIIGGCKGTGVIFSAPAPAGLREQIVSQ